MPERSPRSAWRAASWLKILLAETPDRHQALGHRLVEPHEQPEPLHPRHRGGKAAADLARHQDREEAVDGGALGLHRAPLAPRQLGAELGPVLAARHRLEPALAELQRPDQGAMHHEVGIAPDRRGEMRIAAEIEPEMAEIVRAVGGLALRPQHHAC